jgi:hypothetical protein
MFTSNINCCVKNIKILKTLMQPKILALSLFCLSKCIFQNSIYLRNSTKPIKRRNLKKRVKATTYSTNRSDAQRHWLAHRSRGFHLFTHTDTHTHTHTHTTHTHRDTDRHTHTHTHTRSHRQTHKHTPTHTRSHTLRHTNTHRHTHTHRHTYTHIHTHTLTDTHTDTDTHRHTSHLKRTFHLAEAFLTEFIQPALHVCVCEREEGERGGEQLSKKRAFSRSILLSKKPVDEVVK